MQKPRIALWQKHTAAISRRNRNYRVFGLALVVLVLLSVCISAYRGGWWPSLLDWGVVAIPTILGFAAWVIPVKQTTAFHRWWLFAGGLAFSGLIGLQQWKTTTAHAKEIAGLATKDDIVGLQNFVSQIMTGPSSKPLIENRLYALKQQLETPLLPCDVNGDGKVDKADVQEAADEALGNKPKTFDLDGDGHVTVVDIQRVVLAALGKGCRVGP
jgi:hypothetical protein